jgi:plasmid stability protein
MGAANHPCPGRGGRPVSNTGGAEFRRLVEGVQERLRTRAAEDRGLQAEWEAVLETERDAEQRAFCEKAARLGLDPFSLPAEAAAEVEGLSALVSGELADDLCDALSWQNLGKGGRAVRQFLGSALATEGTTGDWGRVVRDLASRSAENP